MESRIAKLLVRFGSLITLAFLYVPLIIVIIYAFNNSIGQSWPIQDFTAKWFGVAWRNGEVRTALANSVYVGALATLIALILGSATAFAVHRFTFFGRNVITFALVLPIALPGIVTAIALNSTINTFRIPFSLYTIVLGHATFCIVVVYNNVIARLRRTPTSLVEASMDLGADGLQTFRYVTWPAIRTAIIAGALLAFALSFDEIVVTNFTSGTELTIPKFIFNNLQRPRNRPIVNVVALAVVLLSLIPVYFAQRLTGGVETAAPSAAVGAQPRM
jgi:putative spermidine/putrescine transport system permease protein